VEDRGATDRPSFTATLDQANKNDGNVPKSPRSRTTVDSAGNESVTTDGFEDPIPLSTPRVTVPPKPASGISGQRLDGSSLDPGPVDDTVSKVTSPVDLKPVEKVVVEVDNQKPISRAYSAGLQWSSTTGPVGKIYGGIVRFLGGSTGAGQTTFGSLATYKNADVVASITFPPEMEGSEGLKLSITRDEMMTIAGKESKSTKEMAAKFRDLIVGKVRSTYLQGETGLHRKSENLAFSGASPSYCFDAVFSDPRLTYGGSKVPLDDIETRLGLALDAGLGYAFNPVTDPTMQSRSPAYTRAYTF
jgi:hypothetical protein